MAKKVNFSCTYTFFLLPLQRETQRRDVCTSAEGFADILKRRLLALCSDTSKLRNFQVSSDLATIDVLRDIRLSLLCLFWYAFCVYAYAHTRTLTKK